MFAGAAESLDGNAVLESSSRNDRSMGYTTNKLTQEILNVLIWLVRGNVANSRDEEIERLRSLLKKAHEPSLPFAKKVVRSIKRRLRRRKNKKAAEKDRAKKKT